MAVLIARKGSTTTNYDQKSFIFVNQLDNFSKLFFCADDNFAVFNTFPFLNPHSVQNSVGPILIEQIFLFLYGYF